MTQLYQYEPPIGGRISSPKIRGKIQFLDTFEGIEEDADRYELLKLVKRVGSYAGFTSRMIQLLEYYIIFTKDCDWKAGGRPIVYQALSKTALDFGVSERQIQKLENALSSLGAITWNDSGNHRRYGSRDKETGEIIYAYGVDLSPLASMRSILLKKEAEKRQLDNAWMETKRQISWYRCQTRSMIAELRDHEADMQIIIEAEARYEAIAISIRTYMSLTDLKALQSAHKELYDGLSTALNDLSPAVKHSVLFLNSTSTDEQTFAHIDNTNNNKFDKSNNSSLVGINASERSVADPSVASPHDSALGKNSNGDGSDVDQDKQLWKAEIREELGRISWKQVLNACSDRFKEQFPLHENPLSWSDIVEAAAAMLPILGISKSAWWEACSTLGRHGAAICIMIIDQKCQSENKDERIRNPGGYLREMTARAQEGELNLHGSVFGLLKRGQDKHDA